MPMCILEAVEVVLEVVLHVMEVVNGVRMCAMGAGVHALHVVLCVAPYAALNATLYSGGRGARALFA